MNNIKVLYAILDYLNTHMEEYEYKVLSSEELSLLNEWETITGEPLASSRGKLMNPKWRQNFLDEINVVAEQKKSTIESLFEALSKVRTSDAEKIESKEKEAPTMEKMYEEMRNLMDVDLVIEEIFQKYLPAMQKSIEEQAKKLEVSPTFMLMMLRGISLFGYNQIPAGFTRE
jgi:hypothetical protein